MENKPKFIWGKQGKESYFRKTFSLKEFPEKAVLRIFVDTGYELFLNGRFVAAVNELVNTRDYDVTPFLAAGKNVIAVRGINHGGHKGFALELRATFRNKNVSVVSDSTWKTFSEERWGWKCLEYDDSEWKKALVLPFKHIGAEPWKDRPGDNPSLIIPYLTGSPFFANEIPKGIDSPFFKKKKTREKAPQPILEIIGAEYQDNLDDFPPDIIFPVKVCEANSGNGSIENAEAVLREDVSATRITAGQSCGGPFIVLDFGKEVAGYLRLKTRSETRVQLKLFFGETLSECYYYPSPETLLSRMVTEETNISSGAQEWESRRRQGFRFVRMEFYNCRLTIELERVSAKTSFYPANYRGYFSCSDPALNNIWKTGRYTLHLCMQEYYLDGIKRDRILWVGDARLEALVNYYAFGDRELFKYCWEEFAEVQYSDGAMPALLGEGQSIMWDYAAWWVIALGDYYRHTGDREFLKTMKESLLKVIDWLISKTDQRDGLIDISEGVFCGWFCVLSHGKGKELSLNRMFYRALAAVSGIMRVLAENSLAVRYEKLSGLVENSLKRLKETPGNKETVSGSLEGFDRIESYFQNQQPEEAMRFIRRHWEPMLNRGATSFWEEINPEEEPDRLDEKQVWPKYKNMSRCHGWSAGPTYSLLAEVVGIKPTLPGFSEFEVKPQLGKLSFAKGVVPTPFGLIAVSLKYDGKILEGALFVPKGCRAKISLPQLTDKPRVYVDGKRLGVDSAFPKKKFADKNYLYLEIEKPGKHTFRMAGTGREL